MTSSSNTTRSCLQSETGKLDIYAIDQVFNLQTNGWDLLWFEAESKRVEEEEILDLQTRGDQIQLDASLAEAAGWQTSSDAS